MGIPLLFQGKTRLPVPAPVAPVPAAQPNTGAASYPAGFGSNVRTPPSVETNPDEIITVSQNPLRKFLGDQIFLGGALGASFTIDIHTIMGSDCVGFVLIPLGLGPVNSLQLSINGGGFRTILQTVVFDESVIETISLQVPALATAILQLNGV